VNSDLEKESLRQEIERLRTELSKAECERNDHCWTPPQGLQQLLQYTYEIETNNYKNKRNHAERQLNEARVACEKLRKKRTSLIGAFVTTHGKTIDEVDRIISEARTAMGEVTVELSERAQRWKQIERMLSFNIINNSINFENSNLYRNGKGSRSKCVYELVLSS
jgi:stromal interaction molecule 1